MKCPSCGYENSDDAQYCNLCQKSFVKANAELGGLASLSGPRPEPSQESVKAVRQVLRSQPRGENWFERHLNWTWVLAQWAVSLIGYIIAFVFLSSLFVGGTMLPSPGALFASVSVIQLAFTGLQLVSIFGVGAWVLKRKNRSLAWLAVLFIPFVGWIIFLFIENRSQPPPLPVSPSAHVQPGLASPGLGSQSTEYGP